MSRKSKENGDASGQAKGKPTPPTAEPANAGNDARPKLTGRKLWQFRLAAVIGVPFFLLVVAELGLRLAGYGYPTHFFLPYSKGGQELVIQNNQFGWRFFGPAMAREPDAFAFPRNKGPKTIRIFVFGESAAFGDPQSQFGLPRMLEAMLELRHPGVKFEVINAAMTGIDSNVILPIAQDCARADGDVWVVYMGNNEVVGPYGAGTVFGPQAPPVWEIRASLALKSLRLGQVFDSIGRHLHPPPSSKSEWGGMEMFLDQQVRADDPRMNGVYTNFQRNLADIIKTGTDHGVGVVVSTVAVNLKECAPFASAHRPGLPTTDLEKWNTFYQQGQEAQRNQDWQKATSQYAEAAKIDDTFAELRFRQGMCLVGLAKLSEARQNFIAARDLDTLRFRCDSRLNDLIRQAVPANGNGRVLLADAEREFSLRSPGGLPGDELFYEHVHLNFVGNWLLAKSIAPQVEKLLPAGVVTPVPADQPWPSGTNCIQRLAWSDWSFQKALSDILERLHDPPFTHQLSHDYEVQNLTKVLTDMLHSSLLGGITNGGQPPVLQAALQTCQAAIAAWPDDARLYEQLAALKQEANDLPGAAEAAKRAVELLPSSSEDWSQLGLIQGQLGKYAEAAEAFEAAFRLDPEDVWSLYNLGHAYEGLHRAADAEKQYRRAADIKPRFGPAWLALGKLVEARGAKAEAESDYRLAITNRVHHTPELLTLARFCRDRGWADDAVNIFDEAGRLSPGDKLIPYEAGLLEVQAAQAAIKNGNAQAETAYRASAANHFRQVIQLDPNYMPAHFECGMMTTDPGESVREFAAALKLDPTQIATRMNLAMALERAGRPNDALGEYQAILQADPATTPAQYKTTAQQHIEKLQGASSAPNQ